MTVTSRVRKIYELRPYPPPSSRDASTSWALAAIPWIDAVSEKVHPTEPRRILVAGCGVGTEAFAFARQFPAAEVVGVDFSPRSITTARRLLRREIAGSRIRFEVGDLTSSALPDLVGRNFDLISCHGVLSYVPDTPAVMDNFAQCLSRDGVALLGVNGAAHPSVRFRPLLSGFGLDAGEFREGARAREVLRVLDSLTRYPPVSLADMPAGYLAGDVFGPLNLSLPLEEWTRFSRPAGLHLIATYNAYFAVRSLLNRDLHKTIMPRSRAELAGLVDAVAPVSFHNIVLSKRRPQRVDWNDDRKLRSLRPAATALYTIRWPRRRGAWHDLQKVVLESVSTGTRITLSVPQWEVAILKAADGTRSLREILEPVTPAVPRKALAEAMYLLYQLVVINFRPAGRRG